MRDISWQNNALCMNSPVDFFDEDHPEEALQICADCPVKMQCLSFALEMKTVAGVWGGVEGIDLRRALCMSPFERATGRPPVCPVCKSHDVNREIQDRLHENVVCNECSFSWKAKRKVSIE